MITSAVFAKAPMVTRSGYFQKTSVQISNRKFTTAPRISGSPAGVHIVLSVLQKEVLQLGDVGDLETKKQND